MKTKERIYKFIIKYKRDNDGNSPTIRKIKRAVRLKSEAPVIYHLRALESEGKIWYNDIRQICITEGVWDTKEGLWDRLKGG